MALPLSISNTPLVFDALPAIKVNQYRGKSQSHNIYTYARMYILQDALAFSLYCFERTPPPQSRASLVLGRDADALLDYSLSPTEANLLLRLPNGTSSIYPPPEPSYFSGEDEQGWFWGAKAILPPDLLAMVGCHLHPGDEFRAAVLKTRTDEDAFGASFGPLVANDPYVFQQFSRFTAAL